MLNLNRRQFLGAGSLALGLAAPGLTAWADSPGSVLVVVFLRGGMDGLSLLVPGEGPDRSHYESLRSSLRIADTSLLPVAGSPFGWRPEAAGLDRLYRAGVLAPIQAVGMLPLEDTTRSHFDAEAYMELGGGRPWNKFHPSGWLTRHLGTRATSLQGLDLPVVTMSGKVPHSLRDQDGLLDELAMVNLRHQPQDYRLYHHQHWQAGPHQVPTLQTLYGLGDSEIHRKGLRALDTAELLAGQLPEGYIPGGGARYPEGTLGLQFQSIARLIRAGFGVQAVTVEFGGWDTHAGQEDDGFLGNYMGLLSDALEAFHTDLDADAAAADRVVTVVMSEFGRRVDENGDGGTDHGTGNLMLALGRPVRGGRLYGQWPGLATAQQYDRGLRSTTDYRLVLSEIVQRHLGNNDLGTVFPDYSPAPYLGLLGEAGGSGNLIFASGFD